LIKEKRVLFGLPKKEKVRSQLLELRIKACSQVQKKDTPYVSVVFSLWQCLIISKIQCNRFLAAGLLKTSTNKLSPNWQQAFKKLAPVAK
jgi:hypothetical protein